MADLDSIDITCVAEHSGRVGPGTLFLARRGRDTDGHLYIPAALEAGATRPDGAFWSNLHNVAVYRRQLVAKARHLRHTLRPSGEWR